jgi:hypothetical protein
MGKNFMRHLSACCATGAMPVLHSSVSTLDEIVNSLTKEGHSRNTCGVPRQERYLRLHIEKNSAQYSRSRERRIERFITSEF